MRAVLFPWCFFALLAGIRGQVRIYNFADWNASIGKVAAAGDVNGDGYPDIAAWGYVFPNSSTVRVWSGKDGRLLWTAGRYVRELSGPMGDVNGDGADDFAITDQTTAGFWQVDILSGRDGSVLRSMSDPQDPSFGWALAAIGDTDGDGVGDLLLGSRNFAPGGRVQVRSVRSGQVLFSASGVRALDQMGYAVGNAGDVDGDGTNDLLVSMGGTVLGGQGFVYLVAGRTFQLIHTFQGAPREFLGLQVHGIGDVDRDGRADFLMVGTNTLQVNSGRTRALLHARSVQYDHDCRGLGDADGDGWPDLAVDGRTIVSGRTFLDIAHLAAVPYGIVGHLAGIGDLNGDGRADVAQSVGGPLAAWSVTPLPLRSTSHTLSASAGGQQDFGFAAADLQPHWGKLYLLLGTVSGTRPGVRLGSLVLPLNYDPWFDLLVMNPNTLLAGSFGTVAAVMPDARLSLLPGAANALAGQTMFHAFAVIDPLRLTFDFVSNAVPLALLP